MWITDIGKSHDKLPPRGQFAVVQQTRRALSADKTNRLITWEIRSPRNSVITRVREIRSRQGQSARRLVRRAADLPKYKKKDGKNVNGFNRRAKARRRKGYERKR